jgi:enoyl-CoA hydratase/carnithine racemase
MAFREYKHVRLERSGKILTVTLDRPDKLNAFSRDLHRELAGVFIDVAADPESDVVILTGAGRAFSAGGDLDFLESMRRDPKLCLETLREGRTIISGLLDCDKPIICRMNGDAIGLGATLALFCDIIIADDRARISDPHVRVGLVAGDGGALIWPQLIGFVRAKRYLLSGDAIDATEAQQMGLITLAVPGELLDRTVAEWASRLARGAAVAIRGTKATVNIELKQLAAKIMDAGLAYEGLSIRSSDHAAALVAMREKCKPVFEGR